MSLSQARVRFQECRGLLKAVEVRRSSSRPVVSALHRALFALGVVVTSYQAQPTASGLQERLELSSLDGGELDPSLSASVRSAILPLALDPEGQSGETDAEG